MESVDHVHIKDVRPNPVQVLEKGYERKIRIAGLLLSGMDNVVYRLSLVGGFVLSIQTGNVVYVTRRQPESVREADRLIAGVPFVRLVLITNKETAPGRFLNSS